MTARKPPRTSKKSPLKWREVRKVVERHGIEVVTRSGGSLKKLKKKTPTGDLVSIIHAHDDSSEVNPCYIDQIIDKFGIPETEFYG